MVVGFSRIVRGSLFGLFTAVAVLPSSSPVAGPIDRINSALLQEHVRLTPEVRLRKLHLVRPDLIPYPIAYEVCC